MNQSMHGGVGTRVQQFTHLLTLRKKTYRIDLLCDLAEKLKSAPDSVQDGPDPEENIWMPAGYTYFGQFIDHDLTFDNTSSLNPHDIGQENRQPTNLRTPRFDLDSLYGDGPDAMPFMYDGDGASLLFKNGATNQVPFTAPVPDQADQDLLRSPNGRAVIGDKRNDENVIVGQLQLLFLRYHNAVVSRVQPDPKQRGTAVFEQAQREVRWAYQKLVVEDFLPRIVRQAVLQDLAAANTPEERASRYALYRLDKRGNLPREFVVAAYRFGHSAVRQGYRVNDAKEFNIFPGSNEPGGDSSLLGFKPLPKDLVISEFSRFFPTTGPQETFDTESKVDRTNPPGDQTKRLQFAYKIDSNIVDPLGALPINVLPTSDVPGGAMAEVEATIAPKTLPKTEDPTRPSLALLNLLRGNIYLVQGGQEVARVLRERGTAAPALTGDELSIRIGRDGEDAQHNDINIYHFERIDPLLAHDTPLWFYILAEAQAPIANHFGVVTGPVPDAAKTVPARPQFKEFPETDLLNGVGASTQLGPVGGRIIAEVFYGLLDSDDESFINAAPTGWEPMLGGNKAPLLINVLNFVNENPVAPPAEMPPPTPPDAPPAGEQLDPVEQAAGALGAGGQKPS